MNKDYFEKGDMCLDMYDAYGRNPIVFERAIKNYKKGLQFSPNDTLYHYRLGYAYHLMRRLTEASGEYKVIRERIARTFVQSDSLSEDGLLGGLRRGHVFVSSEPLLFFQQNIRIRGMNVVKR